MVAPPPPGDLRAGAKRLLNNFFPLRGAGAQALNGAWNFLNSKSGFGVRESVDNVVDRPNFRGSGLACFSRNERRRVSESL